MKASRVKVARPTARGLATQSGILFFSLALGILVSGCMGNASMPKRKVDATLQRHAKHAGEAFSEGQLQRAMAEYRKAIRRAWALDDPYESGTAAYHLAACLFSESRTLEARDWLLDARVDLRRAGASAGNVWLLEAKIAQYDSRLEDVPFLLQRAACTEPLCPDPSTHAGCHGDDPCKEGCVARIPLARVPCLGPKWKSRRESKDCRDEYQAQVHLLRAALAAEQYDLAIAQRELSLAGHLIEGLCGEDVHAEWQHVAALIHIARGEYLQAGRHLDREAEKLRLGGNYREIPTALELAAAAYEQAGMHSAAADRLCRVARILFGRGDLEASWRYVQLASSMADTVGDEVTKVRLALLSTEILLVLSERGETPPMTSGEPVDLGMLNPAE